MDNLLAAFVDIFFVVAAVAAVALVVIVLVYGKRRGPMLLLIVPTLLLDSCRDDSKVSGWDTDNFKPHKASTWRTTPAGHVRDAGPFSSVAGGFITEDDIDAAIDAGFASFWSTFPEFGRPEARVHLTEDYVFWYGGQWAGGADEGDEILLPLFTRGKSDVDPGAEFIKRAPDANYTWWRFTAEPLVPALRHELLHRVIGDPFHAGPQWARVNGSWE